MNRREAAENESGGESRSEALRISRSYYLRPDQVAAIDDACLDLPAILRKKLSPSKVMERFLDERFAAWVKSLKAKGRNDNRDSEQ